jgi:hypothetical protein
MKGQIVTYILVFGSIFLILLTGLLSFILFQLRIASQRISWHQSFEIAEAGMNYYKWCLNNGVEENCSLEKEYYDISGNVVGKFQIQPESISACNQLISQRIISEGFTFKFPNIKRKISVFYARESVAKYSYILNSNVWVGSDHIIRGPYHSNGGVRFDGQNLSTVSSALENWVCTNSFGCGPEGRGYGQGLCPYECEIINHQCICPGVFSITQNSQRDLFFFPIPPFDFVGIVGDLAQIKLAAQNLGGIYLPPASQINPQGKGWHLIFNQNGQVTAKIITSLSPTCGYSLENDGFPSCGTSQEGFYQWNYFTISSEQTYRTFNISSSCPAIFVEDNLWPEGQISGKVVVAAANLTDPNKDPDVILNYNLDYAGTGNDGLTLIAERNILIGPDSPNYMTLKGIFVAQKGRFSRNHYQGSIRESLTIQGSIVSSGRVGTQWITLGGHIVSGYRRRETFVDHNLIYHPPVFTPFLSSQYKIVSWQEL